jgi:hypothetical protein
MLHYWRSSYDNFGDELNSWIWNGLVSDALLSPANRDVVIVGIGTILDRSIPVAPRRIILGSGAGYARLPEINDDGSWSVDFVRGPLTAKLLGGVPYLTDPAILVAKHCKIVPPSQRSGTIYVPHYMFTRNSDMPEICRRIGYQYVLPSRESRAMVETIAGAKLVLAESMHAAIVADAMRVPWIPIATNPEISSFKWTDFTASLGVPYDPVFISQRSPYVRIADYLTLRSTKHLSSTYGLRPAAIASEDTTEREQNFLQRIMAGNSNPQLKKRDFWLKGFNGLVARAPARARSALIRPGRAEAADALSALTIADGMMSDDARHQLALGQVVEAVGKYA